MNLAQHLNRLQVAVACLLSFTVQLVDSCDVGKVDQNVRIRFSKAKQHQIQAFTQEPKGWLPNPEPHAIEPKPRVTLHSLEAVFSISLVYKGKVPSLNIKSFIETS